MHAAPEPPVLVPLLLHAFAASGTATASPERSALPELILESPPASRCEPLPLDLTILVVVHLEDARIRTIDQIAHYTTPEVRCRLDELVGQRVVDPPPEPNGPEAAWWFTLPVAPRVDRDLSTQPGLLAALSDCQDDPACAEHSGVREGELMGGLGGATAHMLGHKPGSGPDGMLAPPSGAPPAAQRESLAQLVGTPTVTGALEPASVDAVLQRSLPQLSYCYLRELRKDPALTGEVVLDWEVGTDGSVGAVRAASSTLASPAVASCLHGRLARTRFPAPADGGSATVSVRISFADGSTD